MEFSSTESPRASDEIVAVFDAAGVQIGTATRARVYREGLWHGSAGVIVRSDDGGRIYVHRRTDTKSIFPGAHDCMAGGVMEPDEDPYAAATREMAEELGIRDRPLNYLGSISWDGRWEGRALRFHLHGFEVRYEGPIHHQPSEVADGWWWSDRQLQDHLADREWAFVPDTKALLAALAQDDGQGFYRGYKY